VEKVVKGDLEMDAAGWRRRVMEVVVGWLERAGRWWLVRAWWDEHDEVILTSTFTIQSIRIYSGTAELGY
jgi:hypothetical protein